MFASINAKGVPARTYRDQSNTFDEVVQFLSESGFDGMAHAMQTLLNDVMKIERTAVLGAAPCERFESRCGHANGFKPKTVTTRLGKLELAGAADAEYRLLSQRARKGRT